jgi:alpha-tubulin suppressor-like RCC1 family protein
VEALRGKDVMAIAAGTVHYTPYSVLTLTLHQCPSFSLNAGNEHTVILTGDGTVLTAGYNDNGQCGQGGTGRVGSLSAVDKLQTKGVVQVHAVHHTLLHTMH